MIKIYNRKTMEYETEKVAAGGFMKYLYGTATGRVGLEFLLKRKICSVLTGIVCNMGISKGKIDKFIDGYHIDMSECCENTRDFKSFNHFFTRRLKPYARPFSNDAGLLLSPGDGRLRAWADINIDKLVQVKGISYSLKELIDDNELAWRFQGGICLVLRLAPVDYHRFHFIDSGVCTHTRKIKGSYYSVNPMALNSIPKVFCRNKREYSILHSDNFGDVLYIEVGATSVGSIVQTYTPDATVTRGNEKGYFKFGGSTVILLLQKGSAVIDEDILTHTEADCEVRVLAGEAIGRKANIKE